MEIIVERAPGDKQGTTIIDSLLAVVPAGISRGRAFIDDHSTYSQIETVSIPYVAGLRIGKLIEIVDNLTNETWRAKLVGIAHSRTSVESKTTTTLELDRRIAL